MGGGGGGRAEGGDHKRRRGRGISIGRGCSKAVRAKRDHYPQDRPARREALGPQAHLAQPTGEPATEPTVCRAVCASRVLPEQLLLLRTGPPATEQTAPARTRAHVGGVAVRALAVGLHRERQEDAVPAALGATTPLAVARAVAK